MLPDYEATVRALAQTIAQCEKGANGSGDAAAEFLLASSARMPAYLRLPMRLATLGFDVWALPITGRYFHDLPPARRAKQLASWQRSHIGPARMLASFYVSLTLVCLWPERAGYA